MSRMIETFSRLSRLSRLSARFSGNPSSTNCQDLTLAKTTGTPRPSPSGSIHHCSGVFPPVSRIESLGTPVCTAHQQLAPGQRQAVKVAVMNDRRMWAQSARDRVWRSSPNGKPESSREARPFEKKILSRDCKARREWYPRLQHQLGPEFPE
jgi:hypothetical protein